MFLLEENHIVNGVATVLNQIQYANIDDAVSAFKTFIKQSEDHWIVLYHPGNPLQAIGIK